MSTLLRPRPSGPYADTVAGGPPVREESDQASGGGIGREAEGRSVARRVPTGGIVTLAALPGRRWSSRTFQYGYLVTTSLQSLAPPSASPSEVGVTTSGMASSHSVTGGVYKARERIHRSMADLRLLAIPPSCRRVAACNPN